jgi:hypothetical protein
MKDKSYFITFLRLIGKLLPGDYLKTAFYLNCIAKPRKFLRLALNSFYRMDHIYEVLCEFKNRYKGTFSILEFGVADGYSFTKQLYATRYLKMENRVIVHGFDSFEGMPESSHSSDQHLIANDGWVKGQFKGSYENLEKYCREHYSNYRLHKGYFQDTLTEEFLTSLETYLPILVWIDCDYYTSTKSVFERLIPYIPNGCVIYFDEPEFNFGSRYTGEARAINEINTGVFGDGIELVHDQDLSLNTKRVFRFINCNARLQYRHIFQENLPDQVRLKTNDSPLP